jgi:uncharacterized protein involved in exopolysaccharide biosynthesis
MASDNFPGESLPVNSSASGGNSGPAGLMDGISLLDLLLALASRKRMILLVTIGTAVLAALVALALPVHYTAIAVVLPPQQGQQSGSILSSQLANLSGMASLTSGGLGLKNVNEMYASMFRTQAVEDAMIKRFDLMHAYHKHYQSDARKAFEKHAVVDGSKKDGLIYITVNDPDPQRAAAIANGYVDEFRELTRHMALTEAAQRRIFFEQRMEQTKNDLANAEEALKETELKTGLIHLDSQARGLIESAVQVRAQITAKEVQIQSMRTYATGENAQLVQAEHELAGMRAQLARLSSSSNSEGSIIVPKGMVPEAGLEYVRKSRDVKYYETIFEILARQYEVARLDEARQGAVIQMLDPATVPDRRAFPKRSMIVLTALGIGFVLGIVLALILYGWELLNKSPETAEKIQQLQQSFKLRRPTGAIAT